MREIASMGGKALRTDQRAFSRDPQLARTAGKKGGLSVPPASRSFSQSKALARAAGIKGGNSPKRKRKAPTDDDPQSQPPIL